MSSAVDLVSNKNDGRSTKQQCF